MTRLPTFGAALGGAVLLVATLGVSWQAAAQQQDAVAESTLLRVDLGDIPEAGMSGFSGSLGHLAEGAGTGTQTWDQRDPEGVLSYVGGWYGTPPPGSTTVQVTDPAGIRQASAAWNGFGVRLSDTAEGNVLSFGALSTWARCTHSPLAPSAQASAATDSNAVYLFDDNTRPLSEGVNEVTATGEQLGLPRVSTAELAVTIRHVQESDETTARAAVTADISGTLRGADDAVLHRGEIASFVVGDERVDCTDQEPPPTTTPTTTTETPPTTPEPPPTTTTEPPTTTDPPTTPTEIPPPPPTTTSGTQPSPTTSDPQPPTSTGKPPTGTPTEPDPEPTPPTKTSTEHPAPTETECPCEPPPHKGRAENLARTGPAHLP